MQVTGDVSDKHLVLLVHGIRDHALWQSRIRKSLEEAGFTVEPTNFGLFNALQFIIPVSYFRNKAIQTVWRQIRVIRQSNPDSKISVIAHSFGTYVISNIMREEFDMKFHKVIFCGSVVPFSFPFEQIQDRFNQPILNEVGTADIWPAMAESVTWGYGTAGRFGFKRPLVRDRWHEKAHHGFFLNEKFCKKYWIPFLRNESVIAAADDPSPVSMFVRLINTFKIKYFLLALLLYVGYLLYPLLVAVTDIQNRSEVTWEAPAPSENFDISEIVRNSGEARKWLEIAAGEIGQKEVDGELSNPRILEYFKSVDRLPTPHSDNIPWTSMFMNWVMERAGYVGTRSPVSKSWSEWGEAIPRRIGCIAFFVAPTPGAGTGMVGFYLGGSNGRFHILGGNVSNSVRVVVLPDSRFVHCRWPTNREIAE